VTLVINGNIKLVKGRKGKIKENVNFYLNF
jgi:hypothetical protein